METGELLSWLWRASWQASVLVLIVLIVQWVFRARLAPKWRYALWLLVVARLALPVSPESPVSLFNLVRVDYVAPPSSQGADGGGVAVSGDYGVVAATVLEGHELSNTLVPDEIGMAAAMEPTDLPFAPVASSPVTRAAAAGSGKAAGEQSLGPARVAGVIWAAGFFIFSIRLFFGNVRFARRLGRLSSVNDPRVVRILARCAEEMGVRRRMVIVETPEVESPALFGLIRLRLLMPPGMLEAFSNEELRYIFLHELAHVRRGDVAVNWLVACLQTLHWFNPVLWYGFRRLRADRELACDALALSRVADGENTRYGQTILKLLASFSRPAAVPELVGIVEDKGQIKARMRLIAQFRNRRGWSLLAAGLLGSLAIAGLTDARTEAEGMSAVVVEPTPLDLSDFYDLHAGDRSQFGAWEAVPKGRQVFDDVPFEVDGMIRLFGTRPPPHGAVYREEVRGIPVGRKFDSLHVLHGTGWTTGDGTLVARIIFNYADGSRVSFPIVYGEHVRDWWRRSVREPNRVADPNSALAWEGANGGVGLRFYRTTLFNPHPAREVETINIVSAKSLVTPAIVAMTMSGANLTPAPVRQVSAKREAGPLDLSEFYDLHADETSQFGTWEVVPKGRQVFDGVPFDVGGMIRLFGADPPPHGTVYREAVTGIPVGEKFEQIHLLHGTGWTTADGVTIARLVLNYKDGERASFPIAYGEHVRDWWHRDRSSPSSVSDPKSGVAWTGEHGTLGLRFYRTTFTNPHPEREVASVDLISEKSAVTPAIVSISVGPAIAGDPALRAAAAFRDPDASSGGATGVRLAELRLRVVDASNDRPLAGAAVRVNYCDDRGCYYLGSYQTGGNGETDIEYPSTNLTSLIVSVALRGFGSKSIGWDVRNGEAVPERHTIRLGNKSETSGITGRVMDAETGLRIPSFRVFLGEYWGEGRITWGNARIVDRGEGNFALEAEDPPRRGSVLRVESDGYLPVHSTYFEFGDDGQVFEFVLERTGPLSGTVFSPQGDPAAGAEVALLTPNSGAVLGEREFVRRIEETRGAGDFTETDREGRFSLSPDPLGDRIVVVHESGYAEIASDQFSSLDRVTLQPWGTVEGVVMIGGEPNAGREVFIGPLFMAEHVYMRYDRDAFRGHSDEEGRFTLESIPPGSQLIHAVTVTGQSRAGHSHTTPIEVKAGEVTAIQIGGTGRRVVGRFVVDDPEREVDWGLSSASLTWNRPRIPPDIRTTEEYERWSRLEETRRARQQYRRYAVSVGPDGSFRAEDVPSGEYQLTMSVREQAHGDLHMALIGKTIGSLSTDITVPGASGGAGDEVLDLGELTVEVVARIDGGQPAPDFDFSDLDGNTLRLSDFRGKFVLLDFWATWCGPCLQEKPNVQATYDAFEDDDRFEVIALSLDRDVDALKAYVENRDLPWIQGYLGDWSQTDVPRRFGVQGIPAFFLIDPEGRIIAQGMRGERIKAEVAKALGKE